MNPRYQRIEHCRISPSRELVPVLDLGEMALTGTFPDATEVDPPKVPLELVWCPQSGLVQLAHAMDASLLFGNHYGYRSGLNGSMVEHLRAKVASLEELVSPDPGDIVVDIGSNDATTLKAYRTAGLRRLGIDPTGAKFREFYPPEIQVVSDFFTASAYRGVHAESARIVTSIAMFYDLDEPISFAREVASILRHDGVWHLEQSYLPSMLHQNSYDTICHEHLEYYSLQVMQRIMDAADLRIVDVSLNDINGGSFALSVTHRANRSLATQQARIDQLLQAEQQLGLDTPRPYQEFKNRVLAQRERLRALVASLRADGKRIVGYGASTKGNVTLQYCGFGPDDIEAIAEVNQDKFGHRTPGTNIPIVSEEQARSLRPDYFLVLPWHFRASILRRETEYLASGGRFIFPFPQVEIV